MADEVTEPVPVTDGVVKRLARVLSALPDLPDDAQVKVGKGQYSYLSADSMLRAVRPLLAAEQLVILPLPPRDIVTTTLERKRGDGTYIETTVSGQYDYQICGPAGDTVTGGVYMAASDMGDKAAAMAQTQALKYFLRQLLLISPPDGGPAPQPPASAARHGKLSDKQAGLIKVKWEEKYLQTHGPEAKLQWGGLTEILKVHGASKISDLHYRAVDGVLRDIEAYRAVGKDYLPGGKLANDE